jgi:hypothetical protein
MLTPVAMLMQVARCRRGAITPRGADMLAAPRFK